VHSIFLKKAKDLLFYNREEVQSLAGLLTGNRPKIGAQALDDRYGTHDRREGELSHPGYP
jgi:hypothetical protein